MSICSTLRTLTLTLMAVAVITSTSQAQSSRLATFQAGDGTKNFALSVLPNLDASAKTERHVFVLMDTSASQGGRLSRRQPRSIGWVLEFAPI